MSAPPFYLCTAGEQLDQLSVEGKRQSRGGKALKKAKKKVLFCTLGLFSISFRERGWGHSTSMCLLHLNFATLCIATGYIHFQYNLCLKPVINVKACLLIVVC